MNRAAEPEELRLVFAGVEVTLDCGRLVLARLWWRDERGALWARPDQDVRAMPVELRARR